MSKTIKYKGHTITIEKITGWVYTIEDSKEEVVTDESIPLSDDARTALEEAKEFVDCILENESHNEQRPTGKG